MYSLLAVFPVSKSIIHVPVESGSQRMFKKNITTTNSNFHIYLVTSHHADMLCYICIHPSFHVYYAIIFQLLKCQTVSSGNR